MRGLTPEERDLLLRRFRRTGPRVLRGLGALCGVGAVFLSVSFFAGVGYDPDVVAWEVLFVALFAVGCAGAGAAMVRDYRSALESGRVLDQSGPLVPSPNAPTGFTQFQLNSTLVQIPQAGTAGLQFGPPQRLCISAGLRPAGSRKGVGVFSDRGLLISVNNVLRNPPTTIYWQVPPVQFPAPLPPPPVGGPVPLDPGSSSPPPVGASPVPVPVGNPLTVGAPPASGPVFCDRCGQRNAPGFVFCRTCGARRSEVA